MRVAAGEYGFEKSQLKVGGETERLNYLVSVSDQELDGYRAQSAYENKLLSRVASTSTSARIAAS